METIKLTFLSVAVVVFIISIFSLIMPEGRIKPFVKSIFGVLVTFVLLFGIISIFNNSSMNFSQKNFDEISQINYEYVQQLNNRIFESYAENLTNIVKKQYNLQINVKLETYIEDNNLKIREAKILIYYKVLNEKDTHINLINLINSYCEQHFKIDEGQIKIEYE